MESAVKQNYALDAGFKVYLKSDIVFFEIFNIIVLKWKVRYQ